MKAISIKGQWAELILAGFKTIETRTWKTKHRGKLLLCCSKKPSCFFSGLAFAVCDLVDIRPMTINDEKKAQCKVYYGVRIRGKRGGRRRVAYSWILKNIKPIKPFFVKGKLNLFDVEMKKIKSLNGVSISWLIL